MLLIDWSCTFPVLFRERSYSRPPWHVLHQIPQCSSVDELPHCWEAVDVLKGCIFHVGQCLAQGRDSKAEEISGETECQVYFGLAPIGFNVLGLLNIDHQYITKVPVLKCCQKVIKGNETNNN